MTDDEFKRMLGIHPLDHIDFFDMKTQDFLGKRYPDLNINVQNNISNFFTVSGNHHSVFISATVTITWNSKSVIRVVQKVDNALILEMMKELDP